MAGATGSVVESGKGKGGLVDRFGIDGMEDKGVNGAAYGAGNGGQTLGKPLGGTIDGTGRIVGEGDSGEATGFGSNRNNDIDTAATTTATIAVAIAAGDGAGDIVGDEVPPTPTPYEFTIPVAMSLEIFWTPLTAILASILDLWRATRRWQSVSVQCKKRYISRCYLE